MQSFEFMDIDATSSPSYIKLVIIYRPPRSNKNTLSQAYFLVEFAAFIDGYAMMSCCFPIIRDFNIVFTRTSSLLSDYFWIECTANMINRALRLNRSRTRNTRSSTRLRFATILHCRHWPQCLLLLKQLNLLMNTTLSYQNVSRNMRP